VKLGDDKKMDLIKGVPLFADASKGELAQVASIADQVDLPAGRTLITEGESGREFFILIDGTAEVTQGGKTIGKMMGPGDFFGEIALVSKAPRTATITTTTPVRALVITDRAFRQLLEQSSTIAVTVLTALAERLAPDSF
jgi:CRP-like cAMP-binding protein